MRFWGLYIIMMLVALPVAAQYHSQQTIRPVSLEMDLSEPKIENGVAILNYVLPYAGMVELKLFDHREKLVWQSQYINTDGENRIRFKTKPLRSGSYTIWILYKGNVQRKQLVINKAG